jgi:hypothetical protein
MLRRMKFDVLKDSMPIKKWVEVPCAFADSQRDLYINILEKNYTKLNSAIQSGEFKSYSLAFIVNIHFTTLSSIRIILSLKHTSKCVPFCIRRTHRELTEYM